MDRDDRGLLDRARKGDADAFASLFEQYRPATFAVACRLAGDADAEDVVMQAYLKAWQALPGFDGRSELKTWLHRITHNCALDAVRSRRRRAELSLSSQDDDGTAIREIADETQVPPDETVARAELASDVRRALGRLPPEHRTALLLRFTDGLSYSEIAAATGVSIGTVMSRLFYGKRKLRGIVALEFQS